MTEDPRDTNRYYYTIRPMVYKRAKGMCYACGKFVGMKWECHHIRPVHRGGTNDLKNLVCLCRSCHRFLHGDCRFKRRLKKRLCFVGINLGTGRKEVRRWFNYCLVRKTPSARAKPVLLKLIKLAGEEIPWIE
jgi:hypothetical protein